MTEEKKLYHKQYREKNKEKIRALQKGYYRTNKSKVKEQVKKYRLDNLEKINDNKAAYYKRTIADRMYYEAKKRSAKSGIPFDIVPDDIQVPEKCPVLGIPIVVGGSRGPSANSPSLDRVLPALGYVRGNVQVISWRANRLKSDATVHELEAVLGYMRSHEC